MKMKRILFAFVLLFAVLYSHSEGINPADADYCIDWDVFGKGHSFDVRLVLVKKNNDLKNTPEHIARVKCISSFIQSFASFYFVDKLGREIFSFEYVGGSSSVTKTIIDGPCQWRTDNCESEYQDIYMLASPNVEIDFPPKTTYLTTTLKKFSKNDLLHFKDKIVDAQIRLNVVCTPDIDTIHRINFRARITGECGCDSTEYKKNTQKNKK